MPVNYYKRTLKATITNDEKIYEMKEFWNKPEGWEYILPILFGICLNVFIMLFFTGRLEDILIKCLEYLEALKWKIKRKMKRH